MATDKITAGITGNHSEKRYTQEQMQDIVEEQLSYLQNDFLVQEYANLVNFDSTGNGQYSEQARRKLVDRSRMSVLTNPVCKQIVYLYVNYGVGSGLSFLGMGGPGARKSGNQVVLESILSNPKNWKMFSTFGQRKTAKIGLQDGENFFAIFGTGKNTVYRRVDSLSIIYDVAGGDMMSGVATNPKDYEESRYYVQTIVGALDVPERYVVYRDWMNDNWEDGVLNDGTVIRVTGKGKKRKAKFSKDGKTVDVKNVTVSNAQMYHWLFDGDGQRGVPLLNTSMAWCQAQAAFMRDRLAIMRGIATWLYDVKVKGGQKGVNVVTDEYGSTLSNTNSNESNPKPVAGSYRVHNSAVDWKPVPQETGANAARIDGDALMAQAGLGSGIYPQFLGHGELQNYAQSNSMLGPMHKQWEAFQEQLEDMYMTMFRIAGIQVEVNSPELIRKDTPAMLDGFGKIAAVIPGLTGSDELISQILTLFGLDNEETIMKEIQKARKKMPPPEPPPKEPPEGD